MIPDKELYEDIVKVLDMISQETELEYYTGRARLGAVRWVNACTWLKENRGEALLCIDDTFTLFQKDHLQALHDNCLKAIGRFEKEESDRDLDRKYKIKGIIYGKTSLVISCLCALLSLWIALKQYGII